MQVVVGGQIVRPGMSKALQSLGFCPQHDALWETLTVEEHLWMYAALKGIVTNEIPAVIE
jgi:ABC-type multidrug transport system ATPase subunit